MQAEYKNKKAYVTHVTDNKEYVIISYNEDMSAKFKVDVKDITNPSEDLQKKLKREQ